MVEWLCCIALIGYLINHTIILASALPLGSPTSSHCFEYGEVPVGFRGMEYDETAKWLSLHVLQVMAVPARSHLNSLQGFKQILWRFKGPHAGRVPPKGGHTRHHCINCMCYKRKDNRNFMPTTTLHSRQGSTIRGTYLPSYESMAWLNRW